MLNNTRLISLSRTILSTSVKMNDSERLAVLLGDRETDHRAGKEGLEGIPDHIPV